MTSLEELKQLIDYIHRRLPDEEKIDAAEHNRILKTLVDTLAGIGANVFLGIATPETIPEQSPAIKCFYLATKKGNYPRFGDLVINSPLAVIYWNGFDWEKHEIEVSVNVNVDINDYIDLSNYAKLTADNEFVGNQKIIGSLETGETRGKLRPVANRNREMTDGEAVVWDTLLQIIKTVKQVPDSTLWDGNAFDDHLDQAVRTIDNVKFKSVISTDFESKLKGWLIDVLGNAEFRDVLLRSFKSWNFAAGPLGAGVGMVNDDELQTDKLLVRKIMFVLEMMVQRMKFQGGIMVLSPATGFKINRVEIFDTYYRVYCRPEDVNEFEVNDQARIQNFTGDNIKYLWSLTLSKGDDYIDISRIDKDGDGVPAEGDEIVQLGNRTNPDRQDAVLLSAVNGEVGIFTYYGINSFDLSSKEGSWLGKHGEKKGAVIRGEVHITTGSSGLEQFDEYEDVDKRIQDAQNSADSVQDVVNNLISIIIPDLQGQIDGSIMSHEGTIPPTLTNEPAVNWTTEEEKNRHIGDYYDYFLTFDGEKVTERYKFSKLNGVYQWVRVADSGSALAASVAREALGLAGTKATITWGDTLPAVPYNINDVWIKTNGSMYICNHQRLEGETGSQSDWQLFNDTQLRLAQMAADNVISIEEKPSLRDTWDQIKEEFKAYQAQATKYGVSITALQNAYNTLDTFLTSTVKISQDEDTKLSVAQKTEYNQDFANYYSERTTFANVIAQKIADGAVGNIQFGMVNLLKGSNVELGLQGYSIGRYFYDTTPEVGKTYTLVLCYSLGENNTYMAAYQDGGNYGSGGLFDKKGERVIQSHTFKFTCPNSPLAMYFFQFPNGTYGSKVHWAVLVEGNKGPSGWVPALSEQGEEAAKEAVDSMKITSRNLWILKNVCSYASSNVHPDRKPFTIDNYKIIVDKNPADLIGCNIKAPGSKVVVSGKTNLEKITPYYTCRDSNGSVIKSQTSMNIAVSDGRFEFSINNIPANTSVMALGLGYYPFASAYWLDEVSVVSGDKSVGFTPAPEDVDQAIQDAIAKTVDITAPSQVFKYGAGYTGTPTPSSIVLTAIPKNFTPTSYQWQYLNGSTWTNISGATSSTYSVTPGNTTLFPSGTNVRTFRCICDGDEKLSDSFTLAKLADGAAGKPGTDGKGISSTVVTYQASTNGTTVPSGTWETAIPSVSANQYLWTRTIITYTDGTTSTSYSIGKMGATGATGAAGKGIKSTAVTYQASTSGTTVPTGTWGTTIPSVSANQYLWTRTIITYTDNTTSTSYSIGKMGATGAAGAAGKDAYTVLLTNEAHTVACDANGNPLSGELAKAKTKVNAYRGTTKLTVVNSGATTGQFYITSMTVTGGTFVWDGNDGVKCTAMTADTASCTFRVYLESTSVYVEKTFVVTKAKSGENYWKTDVWLDASSYDADKWIPFTGTALQRMGYNRILVSVALNSGTKPAWSTHASGFSVDFDFDMQASGWGTTDAQTLIYADTFKFCPESPVSCGQMTYSSVPVLYLRGGGKYHVKTDFPVTWTPRPDGYTWTSGSYTQSVSPQTSRPKPVGTSIIGRGVRSVANKYAVSSSNTTAPTSWSDTVPSTTTTNKYLWNYEIITYTDGTTAETNKRVIGVHGATGTTGVGIKSITEYYLASASASGVTTSTSGWTTGMQVTTTTKKYLWNYEVVTYTDNNKYTSTPVIIGTHGATGDKGDPGAAGKGVKSTAIAYQASSSGTTTPTGTWSSSIPAVAAGQYLWTRTIITYTDNTTSTMYSVGRMGANGTNGNAGNGVSSTTITYQASTSGTTAPTGTWSSSIPSVAAGSYLWTRTIISYTNGTSSTIYSVGKMGNTGATGQPGESINGKMLYKDPEFKVGMNGVYKYSNSAADVKAKLLVERIAKPSDAPTQSVYCLKVTCKATQSPGYGGMYQSINSRANAVFIQKIIAKIPVGYKINTASNSMGTGYTDTWLTPTDGTGKYTTYLRKVVCGAAGTFGGGGHVYITGSPAPTESAPLEWYIAFMTCYDQTVDGYADIEIVTKDSFAAQLGFTDFEALKANAVKPGKGTLIKGGYINTDLIEVNALIAIDGFVDKLRTSLLTANSIKSNMLAVAGFTFQDYQVYGGSDYGVGPGVKMTSKDAERSFKAYKDVSNYISMFYNSANDWGLKGVVGGNSVFQLGNPMGGGTFIGPFNFTKTQLMSSSDVVIGSNTFKQGFTLENNKIAFGRAVGSIYQRRAQIGIADNAYGSDTLLAIEGGDIWHQGTVTIPRSDGGYDSRSCRFYASDIMMRGEMKMYENSTLTDHNGNILIKNGKFCAPIKSFSLYGSSMSFTPSSVIYGINTIGSANVNVTINGGTPGQILILMNYAGKNFNIVKSNGALVTRVPAEKSAILYFDGSNWTGLMVGDFYRV